ncbi:Uncharacterized protein BP5553_00865 [Venustampulla echinocandica]|uniref:(Trans)glycosidase n=1 Tax=Venustampulla echinocandica TaxID=2656787 RepID=A0A370TZC6_9HELO|nr:Uncharacterized protein BP5553_00865 [Venustampulla echinocandica]RDL40886.1 Uncharacterized protein BP5553_00865 [Venustampulla echinocandica]
MQKSWALHLLAVLAKATSVAAAPPSPRAQACTSSFDPITASAAFAALNPGWNAGNTLDGIPNEDSWGNSPLQLATLTQIQAKGFNSVRIPVTWAYHFDDESPTWNVNKVWMNRVETVVDQALSLGLSVVLNVHHDSWVWADPSVSNANTTMIKEKFSRLWAQIGTRFACKSSKLIFEPLNEPAGSEKAHADLVNNLNGLFLEAINQAGGHNPSRVVSLSGLGMSMDKTEMWFVRPTTYPNQPWGLQFHYYSPYDFIFSAWGKTIWGSDEDKAAVDQEFALFKGNFTNIPAFVGEWDASVTSTETAGRWKYFDYFIRTCNKYGYSSIIWDNGGDFYNRNAAALYDPATGDILVNAVKGISNTLADSTEDASATSQTSSAYIFHKFGDPVVAQSTDYLLNGNTFKSITNSAGKALDSSQYSMSSTGKLTLSATYLQTLYTSEAAAGTKETLTLKFSAGASLSLQIVQYSTPTISQSAFKIDTSTDLHIPITYQGLPKVAAVKALLEDGTYLADDWTQYLGPLQQARWTYGSWGFDKSTFSIYVSGLTALKNAGKTVTLTLEFFPRIQGQNSVNITFTQ